MKFNGEAGLPHSEIVGSKFAHNSPTLIAACHVLHRLCMPRHPPNALTSRLRVHTANVRVDRSSSSLALASRSLPNADDLDIISACYSALHLLTKIERRIHGIDFKNPFTMSKSGKHLACLTGHKPDLLSSVPERVGGASRDRTDDLKLAKLALSQLSYGPVNLS